MAILGGAADELPLPLEQVSDLEALLAMFGSSGPTPRTPLGSAFLWTEAISRAEDPQSLTDAQRLSTHPEIWDYGATGGALVGWSIMQNVHYPEGRTDIAHVRLLYATAAARTFDSAEIPPEQILWLTLVGQAPYWYVWGLNTGDDLPQPDRIKA